MFRSLAMLMVCLVLTSCAAAQPAAETAEAEVQKASDEFWALREGRDASALSSRFTETGIYMVPGLPDAVGHSAIRALMELRLSSGPILNFKIHRREIEVIGDTAYELAWYSEEHHPREGSNLMEGRYAIVWQRGRAGDWRVHRYLYNFSAATPIEPPAN